MVDVVIYSSDYCPYCHRAKRLLTSKGQVFRELCVDGNPALRQEAMAKSGRTSVPQIWINGEHVGGCDDLYELERRGLLDAKLGLMP